MTFFDRMRSVFSLHKYCTAISSGAKVSQIFLILSSSSRMIIEVFAKLKHCNFDLFHHIIKSLKHIQQTVPASFAVQKQTFFLSERLLNLWLQIVVIVYRSSAKNFDNFSYFSDNFFDFWNDIKTILLFLITFLFIRFFLSIFFSVTFVIRCSVTSTITIATLITYLLELFLIKYIENTKMYGMCKTREL